MRTNNKQTNTRILLVQEKSLRPLEVPSATDIPGPLHLCTLSGFRAIALGLKHGRLICHTRRCRLHSNSQNGPVPLNRKRACLLKQFPCPLVRYLATMLPAHKKGCAREALKLSMLNHLSLEPINLVWDRAVFLGTGVCLDSVPGRPVGVAASLRYAFSAAR